MSFPSVHLFLVLGVFSLLAGLDLNLPMNIENGNFLRLILQEKVQGQQYCEVVLNLSGVACWYLTICSACKRLVQVQNKTSRADFSYGFTKVDRSPETCTGPPQS